jgi:hypothetical protein
MLSLNPISRCIYFIILSGYDLYMLYLARLDLASFIDIVIKFAFIICNWSFMSITQVISRLDRNTLAKSLSIPMDTIWTLQYYLGKATTTPWTCGLQIYVYIEHKVQ